MGTRVPVIVSIVAGVLGKEVCNDKAGEVLIVFFISSRIIEFCFCFSKLIYHVYRSNRMIRACTFVQVLLYC